MFIDKPYIDKNKYLLFELENFDLSDREVLLCVLINAYNEAGLELTYEMIGRKLGITVDMVDKSLQSLVDKKYLKINVNGHICYDLSGLYSAKPEPIANNFTSILRLFEEVFNRVLNTTEMTILNELISSYSEEEISDALRQAEVYQKGEPNIFYVKAILQNAHDHKG